MLTFPSPNSKLTRSSHLGGGGGGQLDSQWDHTAESSLVFQYGGLENEKTLGEIENEDGNSRGRMTSQRPHYLHCLRFILNNLSDLSFHAV